MECGVWRGGSAIIAAEALLSAGGQREILLYDTFSGMVAPQPEDIDFLGRSAAAQMDNPGVRAVADVQSVQRNLAAYPNVQLVIGRVEDTLPATAPGEIALLRLDTDRYESTRHELVHLWPRLAVGGILIVDDYGHWRGARRAVGEYFAPRRDQPLLTRLDYTGRLAVKTG